MISLPAASIDELSDVSLDFDISIMKRGRVLWLKFLHNLKQKKPRPIFRLSVKKGLNIEKTVRVQNLLRCFYHEITIFDQQVFNKPI